MYLSLKILSELVDLEGLSIDEIANKLTMSTAEIDGVEKINHHFETIVTAKLLEVKKHPDSDHLTIVKADTGSAIYDLICAHLIIKPAISLLLRLKVLNFLKTLL